MQSNIHDITEFFASANVCFAGAFLEQRKQNDSNRVINRRTNPFCGGLILPLSGSARLVLNNTVYNLSPGMIVHAGPDMSIKINVCGDEPWCIAVLHYKIPPAENESFPLFCRQYFFPIIDHARLLDLFQALHHNQTIPGAAAKLHSKRLFMDFLEALLASAEEYRRNGKTDIAKMVQEYILQNYAQGLSITQIADHFKIDRRNLSTVFKQHIGMTPSSYLIECRILKAKELLYACNCPIKQIAECVGYSDSLFFSRAFKKRTGVSPTEYRLSVKNA